MKLHRIFLVACVLGVFALNGCDVVDNPIDPNAPIVTTGKKVLIEDFTGAQCGNCPRAHEAAATLKNAYGDNLVVVGIHVGIFAEVDSADGYFIDFTSPFGDSLDSRIDANGEGLPTGMVSRKPLNGEAFQRYANWGTVCATVLAEAPILDIAVEAVFDASTRNVTITSSLEYFQAGTADHQIVVLMTEDSILSRQADYSLIEGHIDDYYQRHVVRGSAFPGPFGEPVKGAEIFIGERFTKSHTIKLKDDWNDEHCAAVVYVLDRVSGEILQVEEAHVVPQ